MVPELYGDGPAGPEEPIVPEWSSGHYRQALVQQFYPNHGSGQAIPIFLSASID